MLGHLFLVAISTAGTGVNDALYARATGGIKHVNGSGDTGFVCIKWVIDTAWNGSQGRLVEDDIDIFGSGFNGGQVAEISLNEFDLLFDVLQVLQSARAEIVKDSDPMSVIDQPRRQMRSNEACTAGY
jgi:hypothetical protein